MPDIFVWKGLRKKFKHILFWSSVRRSGYWTHRTLWTLLGSQKIPAYRSPNKIFCSNVGLGEGRQRGVVSQKTCYFSGRCWAVNSRCLKLYRGYSISFYSSNVGELFWSWILKDCIKVQEKKRKVVFLCSGPRQNLKLGTFVQLQWTCKVVVLPIKPISFLPFLLPSPSPSPSPLL